MTLGHGDNFPFYEGPGGECAQQGECAVCGKTLSAANTLYVQSDECGKIHDPAMGETGRPSRLAEGYPYPVGSECAKKFAAGIAFKIEEVMA